MADKGAHFHRCDLQVHSPRDIMWDGAPCVTDDERQAYAATLVQACRQRELQGIAVSDHHDMLFVKYVRRAALEETDSDGKPLSADERLVVFPAMELTLGVPCQALLIFDADLPEDLFPLVMNALALTPSAATESKTAEVVRLQNIVLMSGLKAELDKHAFLKDRYIVFPNVTNEGKSSILRDGFPGKYIEMPCVGGYVDGDIGKLKPGNLNKINGKEKAWGNKRIACFQTSDNRRADHADLGKFSTWVKWATPTAEALRQACLAQESRVSHEPPSLPSVVIGSISVSNSVFLGPVDLELNPQYSALIGGRGTGKSTILEYLRWALCDQPPRVGDEETPNYQARRSRLIEQTLKPVNATVTVRFEVNDVPHVIRRNSQDGSLLIKIGADEFRRCTEDEVRGLLPIQAYSQKQLSDVSVRFEELGRFVNAPIRADLARIDRDATDRASRVRQAHATLLRQRELSRTVKNRALEEKSLTEQATKLRDSLKGLSEEDRAAIDRGKTFQDVDSRAEGWRDAVTSIASSIEGVAATVDAFIEDVGTAPSEPEFAAVAAAHAEYTEFLTLARDSLRALTSRAAAIALPPDQQPPESPWRKWAQELATVRAAYEAAVQRSSAHSEKMKQLKDTEDRLAQHARETSKVTDELKAIATAESAYTAERNAWLALQDERTALLVKQAAALTEKSGGAIRAQIRRYGDATDFVGSLRQALTGSRVQSDKIEAIGQAITSAADGGTQWAAILHDLERLAEFDPEKESQERRPDTPALASAGIKQADQERIARAFKPAHWLSLSLTPIANVPVFEYRARESEYIPFKNASAGQQATALLKTLLNQSGPPLIIDQPEEDLDNPVMLEIVEQVWKAKQNRQLVFASHNANLVVNGDAELVAWCEYRTSGDQSRGTIAGTGAIDVPEAREAIKRIMEGGEAAFNLRKNKYGF
jgi:DNA repair ATPase RecN